MRLGRAGVPMEVMGLMLGEFVDDYTVRCIDVFAMPQSGTGVSVEAVDPVFQTKMLDMLKQTGRFFDFFMILFLRTVEPFFAGLRWLLVGTIVIQVLVAGSLELISTRSRKVIPALRYVLHNLISVCFLQSFEALNQRAVSVVIDPIQSVKGKVVIDAFRLINPQLIMLGVEPRQTTSTLGHLNKPSIQARQVFSFASFSPPDGYPKQALIHGLNRHYYSIAINYRKNELEERMLLNLHKKQWTNGLTVESFDTHNKNNEKTVQASFTLLCHHSYIFSR